MTSVTQKSDENGTKGRISRREFLRISAGLTAASMIGSGCQLVSTPAPTKVPAATATQAPAAAPAVTSVPAAATGLLPPPVKASRPTTITWWHWVGFHTDTINKLAQEYQKQYDPNLSLESTAYPTTDQMFPAAKAALLGGGGPDILSVVPGGNMVEYVLNEQLVPYTQAFLQDPEWKQSFYPHVLDMMTINSEVWGVTPLTNAVALWYNKSVLDKYNLEVPTTLDELKHAGEVLNSAAIIPVAWSAGESLNHMLWLYCSMVAALGITNMMRQADVGKVSWTTPELVQAMELSLDLAKAKIFSPGVLGLKQPEAIKLLATGKAAMLLGGSWIRSTLRQALEPGVEIGFAPFPALKPGGSLTALFSLGVILCVNANSKYKDLAFEMARWITGNPGRATYVAGIGIPPSGPLTPEGEEEVEATLEDSLWPQIMEVQSYAKAVRELFTPEVQQALGEGTQAVLLGNNTPKEACQQIEEVSKKVGPRKFSLPEWNPK